VILTPIWKNFTRSSHRQFSQGAKPPCFPSIPSELIHGIANAKKYFSSSDMKPGFQKRRDRALTLPEVLVIVAILVILAANLLLTMARHKAIHMGINCVGNLKQVDLSFLIWAGDNNNKYPMAIPVAEGGAKELIVTGDVAGCLMVMTNELSTPKILICPLDRVRTVATNFGDSFNNSHISYFLGVDVTNESNPNFVLTGDDNFAINGASIKSGVAELSTNVPVSWGTDRHIHVGNLGFADGSVSEFSISGLQNALQNTGLATNRLAIP
jgi:hypothetical protein